MFAALRDLKKMFTDLEAHTTAPKATKATPTDEQILADFIKMFN